jgi:hypothetical protein
VVTQGEEGYSMFVDSLLPCMARMLYDSREDVSRRRELEDREKEACCCCCCVQLCLHSVFSVWIVLLLCFSSLMSLFGVRA